MLGSLADRMSRGVESAAGTVSEAFFEPSLRLGVTGLSRAGKTVFITSLVANLMNRGRMPQLLAAQEGRVLSAFLQPQPDNTVARFPFEDHLTAMTGPAPYWPEGTRSISELRLSLRVREGGMLAGMTTGLLGPKTIHLDIVDYPGEWLLDLALLDKSYDQWAAETLERLPARPGGAAFLAALSGVDGAGKLHEPEIQGLAAEFTKALHAAKAAGFSDCSPGRFLLPGDMAGAPVLSFAPLPPVAGGAGRNSLRGACARRFEAYKREVIKPFFRDHFARIDRQVVLADVLGAVAAGPAALEDLRRTLAEILAVFRPGRNQFLTQLLLGRRVERILFAATKADHIHHSQHSRLTALTEAMLREAKDRADFRGARSEAMSLASLRCTTEEIRAHQGQDLAMVRGRGSDGRLAAFHPGDLPMDPARLLSPARGGAEAWAEQAYRVLDFAPAAVDLAPGEGPPHIRMDRAAQFLIGDRL